MKFIDSHCHIHLPEFDDDRNDVISRAHEANVKNMIVVGNDHESNKALVSFVHGQEDCFMVLGIHPYHVDQWNNDVVAWMKDHMLDKKLLGVGETGLDYFRNTSSPLVQEKMLRAQIELAIAYRKPVVLHVRDAFPDIKRILCDYPGLHFVMHCFAGNGDDVAWIIERGGYISLSGIVTFPNAKELQETVKSIPIHRLLVETDAPFLAPRSHRGQRCEPSFVVEIVQKIAELQAIPMLELSEKIYENTKKAFDF